jgi:hypothetical protein
VNEGLRPANGCPARCRSKLIFLVHTLCATCNGPRLHTDDPNTFSRFGESLGTWGLSYEDHRLGRNRLLRT